MVSTVNQFDKLLKALNDQGFNIRLRDVSGDNPRAVKYEQGKTFESIRDLIGTFPVMSASKGALKRALEKAGWRPVRGKFPQVENNRLLKHSDKKAPMKTTAYYVECVEKVEDRRTTAVIVPQLGEVNFHIRIDAQGRAKTVDKFYDKHDERSPLVQFCDKFRQQIIDEIPPGLSNTEARHFCIDNLAPLLENIPEHQREDLAKNAVKTWGKLGTEGEEAPDEEQTTPAPSPAAPVVKSETKEALARFYLLQEKADQGKLSPQEFREYRSYNMHV